MRLSELSQCAHRLGLVFGEEAERAEDWARKLEYFRLFDRCFFAVRVATALELRLRRERAAGEGFVAMDREGDADDLAAGPEGERPDSGASLERERLDSESSDADREDSDRDRDQDREREGEAASLPVLLRTLEGGAADATSLSGPQPEALPSLRGLLAHVAPEGSRTLRPESSRSKADLRARLAGSGAAVMLQPSPQSPKSFNRLAARHATGPPCR